jgi:hypothetical protein
VYNHKKAINFKKMISKQEQAKAFEAVYEKIQQKDFYRGC